MSKLKSKVQFWLYRVSTVCKSLKALYTLPQEKIDAFLNAYKIFEFDWKNEKEIIGEMGPDYYQQIQKKISDYYGVLNHLCAVGQVEKMYIPPAIDLSKSIIQNQTLYEERMSRELGVGKGKKVLDIGCGRGRVASFVATYTGANVVGMNIDPVQLAHAKEFAERKGLSSQCEFQLADLNNLPLPFPDQFFDGIYHIQVFTYSKNLELFFKELYRIMKPGAKLACLDWVRLDKYDAKNPRHLQLMSQIKPLIAAIGTPSVKEYEDPLKKAGFTIVKSENASIDGLQAPLIENADRFFTRVTRLIRFLVRWKVLPAHFKALFDRLTKDGQAFVEADRMRLVTTSYYIVAQKN